MAKMVVVICVFMLLAVNGYAAGESMHLRDKPRFYNPDEMPRTFEDLFLPHWLENGTYSFDVPGYVHEHELDFDTTWARYYQYGYEKGRIAILNITDEYGHVYLHFNNSNTANGTPIGGPGLIPEIIKGDKLYIQVVGKVLIQFGFYGEWVENIIEGGVYSITFNWGKVALFMDYYNPTNVDTFYFNSTQPVYAYLIASGGDVVDYIDTPVKKGYLTEPWDATPFLVFIRPPGQKGNVTVHFWAGPKPAQSGDFTGALLVFTILTAIAVTAYFISRKSIEGRWKRK